LPYFIAAVAVGSGSSDVSAAEENGARSTGFSRNASEPPKGGTPAISPEGGTTSAMDLSGTWRFRLDPKHVGIEEKWFATRLPDEIDLPGTTDEAKLGLPNPAKPSLEGLYRPNVYAGPAWYQRDIDIPAKWKGKRAQLFLERVHWETRVWLDGHEVGGMQDSLVAPHLHELGELTAGKHVLTICVDNRLKFDLGRFVSVNYEGTQTNWNGIIGKLELRAVDAIWIKNVQVYPDVANKWALVKARVHNATGKPLTPMFVYVVCEKKSGRHCWAVQEVNFESSAGEDDVIIEAHLREGIIPWDEFSPNLYELQLLLYKDNSAASLLDERTVTFGMRKLEIRGTQFVLNGRPLFLRGTLECAIFLKTGYPAMDVPAWQRIFRILKSYGLNFMRFHSWCPPEAAFAAADSKGFYLQVEGPEANIRIDRQEPIGQFMEQELLRIVRTYGNHPSFLLMTLGNEHNGVGDTLDNWVKMLREEDPRHFYSSASSGQMTPSRQFTEGGPRGVKGPATDRDFGTELARQDRPLMGHEIGQWTFFPNFDEIPKYDGVLQAKNFELVRDDLASKHLLDLAPQFVQATGRHAVLLYKEEIEVLRRTPGYPGFSLLDMHDYPGQGTALVGPLDPFWDSKGFVTPEEHARYCGPTAPLLRLKKRTFTADETLTAEAQISHFGRTNLAAAVPEWTIRGEKGTVVASGALLQRSIPSDMLSPLGKIETPLSKAAAPCKLTVNVSIRDTPITNSWDIWVYPPKVDIAPPKGLVVARQWNDDVKTTLAHGGRVLLLTTTKSAHSLPGRFLPVFWSPVWFPTQVPNTMGILCDPQHPALADFPTDFYSNWQWYDLLDHSRSIILDDTPAEFRPVVMVIDNFARNHKLGVIFEARVAGTAKGTVPFSLPRSAGAPRKSGQSPGRLLVCGIDLPGLAEKQPAARQLLASLQRYAGSDKFQPRAELSVEILEKLFAL